MNRLARDGVAIDTNVFGHLINGDMNKDKHINTLLKKLREDNIYLLVDTGKQIEKEYKHHLKPYVLEAKSKMDEAYILFYWMIEAPRKEVVVKKETGLWDVIKQTIPEEKEENDRIFVYVAFVKGCVLVSNDRKHIVDRRTELKECCTSGYCPNGADVMGSEEAFENVCKSGA